MLVRRTQKQVNRDLRNILKITIMHSDQVEEIVFALQLGLPTSLIKKTIANPKLEPKEMKHKSLKQYHTLKRETQKPKQVLERKELLK